jgi:transcriptional regulator with XRE-family HTH domain/tetratricopeptide (TPR) repeat protein
VSAERSAVVAAVDDLGRPGPALDVLGGSRQEVAAARLIRARELVAGSSPGQIAAVIASQCGSSRIRAYRLALGIALADVVAQVRARFEADGRPVPRFSETLLSAYESGQKRPGPEYLHYLCAAYQADPADLGFEVRCLCGGSHRPRLAPAAAGPGQPPRAVPARPRASGRTAAPLALLDSPAATGRPDGGGPAAVARGEDEDDELRRMLIRQMTAAGCRVDSRFLGAVDRIRRRMDDALLGGTVSAPMLDAWEQAAAGYGRQYMTVPALRLVCDVLLDLADVRRMCEERQPLEFSERLCRLAAQLAGLAGISMLDIGDHRLARLFFRTARTAADETGDRQLRAWVAAREALGPLYYGDPGEAASLAGGAADLAGRALCAAAVMAPVIEARARARLTARSGQGRREALSRARAALDCAADAIADLPAGVRADTALGYTERQFYFHAGDTLVLLGDWRAAQRAFGLAAELYPDAELLDRALVALGQARCLLESGEPTAALGLSRDTVLGLPPEHRTAIIRHVARLIGQAASERHPRLGALSEYTEALSTA